MIARFKNPASRVWVGLISVIALAHVGVLLFCRKQIEASNVIQVIAAVFVVATCFLRSKRTADPYLQSAWFQLGGCLHGLHGRSDILRLCHHLEGDRFEFPVFFRPPLDDLCFPDSACAGETAFRLQLAMGGLARYRTGKRLLHPALCPCLLSCRSALRLVGL